MKDIKENNTQQKNKTDVRSPTPSDKSSHLGDKDRSAQKPGFDKQSGLDKRGDDKNITRK